MIRSFPICLKKRGANPENVGLSEPRILPARPFYFFENSFGVFSKMVVDPLKMADF